MDYADSITAERVKRVIHGYPTNKKDMLYDTAITTRNIKDGGDLFAEAKEIAEDAKDSYDKVEGPKWLTAFAGHRHRKSKRASEGDRREF